MNDRKGRSRRRPRLSFVGVGAVGTAFAVALHRKGFRIDSVISSRITVARALAAKVETRIASDRIEDISQQSDVLFITVPDHLVGQTAEELAKNNRVDFSSIVCVHTSGALPSDALSPLTKKGAHALSLHPIQSFPRSLAPHLLGKRMIGIHFGAEGDPEGIAMGKRLVAALEGRLLLIPKDFKPLYHVACVLASNYLVALMSLLDELYGKLRLEEKNFMNVFEKLILSTVESVKRSSPREALTGPIERADVDTIRRHLSELSRTLPYLIPFYTVMGMETIRLAIKKGTLSTKQAASLLDAMSGYVRKEAPDELLSYYQEHRN
jgi:predicted short-subunit dehydrogenase-like oxidoreductase (DUF2520 family)